VNASGVTQLPELVAFLTEEPRAVGKLSVSTSPNVTAALDQSSVIPDFREWTRRIKRGDEEAFTRFYELYSLRVYRYLLVLARGNELDARDVLQSVMLKAANRFKIFDDESRLWAWLCRLSRNAFVDLCRSRKRHQRFIPLEAQGVDLLQSPATENQMVTAMSQVMERLAPEERELIRCAYVDKQPLQSLADQSGQTYKAMESRLARLRLKMKTQLLKNLRHE
jgi:RNA polymerase sigma-70 factor (ECF subfamily)